MKAGIYCAINVLNGKRYVGSSKVVERRWARHCYDLRRGKHNNCHLQGAWNKDGEQMFVCSVIEYCEPEKLLEREDHWIAHFDSRNPERGYNFWSARRHECSPETRAKLSAAHKGKPKSPEHVAKVAAALTGKKLSPERCAAISARNKGRVGPRLGQSPSEETRAKIAGTLTGRKNGPCSEATKAKIAATQKGKPRHSPEARAKMSETRRGVSHGPCKEETKAKISAAHKGRKLSPEWIAKMAATKRGSKATAETRARMSAAQRERWAARREAKE